MKHQNLRSVWTIIASIIFVATIVGGGFYLWQRAQTPKIITPKINNSYQVSALCTDASTGTAIGRDVYPINPKYNNLGFLGQLFTAYNCGSARVNKIFGVTGDSYALGSTIWLNNNPSQSLIDTFESIGFTCSEEIPDTNCKKWQLWGTTKIENLMKLEPYSGNFKADDCTDCG